MERIRLHFEQRRANARHRNRGIGESESFSKEMNAEVELLKTLDADSVAPESLVSVAR